MSQAGIVDVITNNPDIPTRFDADISYAIPLANVLEIKGVAAQGVETTGDGLNKITITVKDATTTTKGVAQFDSTDFSVTSGVVTLNPVGAGQTLTGDNATAIPPAAGNWNLFGTINQVSTVGSGSTITFSTPTIFIAPGTIKSTTTTEVGSGNLIVTAGNVAFSTNANAGLTTGVITWPSGLRIHNFGNDNTFIGNGAGNGTNTGANNVSIGLNGLSSLTSGIENMGIGANCLRFITSGSSNCGMGIATLRNASTSNNNTCIGHNSGNAITTGVGGNVGIGYQSLLLVATGAMNTGIGYQAGKNYTLADSNNICIGQGVGGTLGESNVTRIGTGQSSCFVSGITGVTAVGAPVAVSSTGQLSSLGFGTSTQVLTSNGAGASPTWQAASARTLTGNTGPAISPASGNWNINTNTAVSGLTVNTSGSGSTIQINVTDGSDNIFMGRVSGKVGYSGSANIGVGYGTFQNITTASNNCAHGGASQNAITTGTLNCSFGHLSLSALQTEGGNCAFGGNALQACTHQFNTAIGYQVLQSLLAGRSNTAVGQGSGINYTGTESSNILLKNPGTLADANTIRIGQAGSSEGQVNKCFIAGISGVTITGGATTLCDSTGKLGTIVSAARYKENIEDVTDTSILALNPVKFNYKSDETKTKVYGFIAEEVEEVCPELCIYGDGNQLESVKYHEMPALLLKEIQRLNQRIDALYDIIAG